MYHVNVNFRVDCIGNPICGYVCVMAGDECLFSRHFVCDPFEPIEEAGARALAQCQEALRRLPRQRPVAGPIRVSTRP